MNRILFVLLAFAPIFTDTKKVKVNRRSEFANRTPMQESPQVASNFEVWKSLEKRKNVQFFWISGKAEVAGRYYERIFVRIFSKCPKGDPSFDDCMKDALNEVRPYFKYGVPEFNIPPFDPFFAEEVIQTRGGQSVNFKLTLRNVYESGWTESKVYRFKSDLKNGIIRYFQWFPSKFLQGEWEFEGNFMGPYSNSGTFDLSLYNYTQVTTVRSKRGYSSDPYTPYAVRIQAIDSGDMELHVSNLFNGVSSVEYFLDRAINISWRPGFMLLKPLIDDLVSNAFTKIFNDAFRNFPFEQVFYK